MDICTVDDIYVNKILIDNDFVYIFTNWSDENTIIKILDIKKSFHNSWSGIITKNHMETIAKDLNMSYLDFKEECKSALATNKKNEGFSYHLNDNKFKLQKCKKFKVNFLEVELNETAEDLKNIFLNYSVNITEKHIELLSKKDGELNHLKTEIVNLISAYEKCKAEKNDLEKSLFTKFVLLLNTKKKRIKKIESILAQEGIPVVYGQKRKQNDSAINEEDLFENNKQDDFDAETQIMTPEEEQLRMSNILNLPKRQKVISIDIPSTSKGILQKDFNFNDDKGHIQTCKEAVSFLSRSSPGVREENSSEEYFAKM